MPRSCVLYVRKPAYGLGSFPWLTRHLSLAAVYYSLSLTLAPFFNSEVPAPFLTGMFIGHGICYTISRVLLFTRH